MMMLLLLLQRKTAQHDEFTQKIKIIDNVEGGKIEIACFGNERRV